MRATTFVKAIIGSGIGLLGAAAYIGALDRFHMPQPMPNGKIRVACIGDSITYGCFVAGQPWNSYPRQLGRLLGNDYCVGNFGYTNRTAINTADFPYTEEKLYKNSLDFQPDIVVIMLGTNDTKEHNWNLMKYLQDIGSLIDSYKELETQPELYLMLPPPVFPFLGKVLWGIRSEVLDNELIPVCRKVAEEKDVILVDGHKVFRDRKELFVDGVHPNRKGAKLLAETVYSEMIKKEQGYGVKGKGSQDYG